MVFLRVLRSTRVRDREARVLLLGLDNAGKTTAVKKLNGEDTDEIPPTLGFQIHPLEHRGLHLNVWDIGGQRTIRGFWRNYYEETDALVWVVDSTDVQRLDECRQELAAVLKEEKLLGSTLVVLANKADLPSALSAEEVAQALQLHETIRGHPWSIFSCSARWGDGIAEAFDWMCSKVSENIR